MLSNENIKSICMDYAYTGITLKKLASKFNCSTSTISKALHTGIANGLVPLDVAKKIQAKAVANSNAKIVEKGYAESMKVYETYENLIRKGYLQSDIDYNEVEERIAIAKKKLAMLKESFEQFDSTYSDADEYTTTIDDISSSIDNLEEYIKRLNAVAKTKK